MGWVLFAILGWPKGRSNRHNGRGVLGRGGSSVVDRSIRTAAAKRGEREGKKEGGRRGKGGKMGGEREREEEERDEGKEMEEIARHERANGGKIEKVNNPDK